MGNVLPDLGGTEVARTARTSRIRKGFYNFMDNRSISV